MMTTPRVDLFTVIHKALRANMYQTGSLLERTDFGDQHDKQLSLAALDRTLDFLEEHLELEDRHVVPLLSQASEEVSGALQAQHQHHEIVAKRLRDLKSELACCGGNGAVGLGAQLCKAYNKMLANQSAHMNQEEGPGNAALWGTHSDEVLAATRAAIQTAMAPARYQEWLSMMIPNANHQELVGMFSGMKAAAPPEVFSKLTESAAPLLGERWDKVQAKLES